LELPLLESAMMNLVLGKVITTGCAPSRASAPHSGGPVFNSLLQLLWGRVRVAVRKGF